VHVDVQLTGDLRIQADSQQLTQLFTNLLANAYEAMEGSGRIVVTADAVRMDDGLEGRDAVVVSLTDDGPGMPQDVADRVFEPFFTTKPAGTGLGLAVCKKLLEGAGARLSLDSAPGRGTRAIVTLPRDEA
jgi:signal transduction histidine kinase